MQQDPSSWNKPLPYPTKSSVTTSTSSTTVTTTAAASSVVSAAVVAVAASSTANTTGTATGSSALPPPTIRSRSSASTPCLTSSHVRPNTNHNSDVLAIHHSFDLSKPSSPPSPSSPLSSPSTHLDSIDAIVGYQSEHEPSLSQSTSSTSPDVSSLSTEGKTRHDWPQYNSKPTISLRDLPKDQAQGVENNALGRGNIGTRIDYDCINGANGVDVDMQQDTASSSINNNKISNNNNNNNNNTTSDHLWSSNQTTIAVSKENHSQDQRVEKSICGSSNGDSGEWQGKNTNSIQIQVCSSDKARTCTVVTSSSKDISLSRMSPGDIRHLPSSISPTSSGTASCSDIASTASSASSSISNSLSLSSSSALHSSKELTSSHHDLQVNIHLADPIDPSLRPNNASSQSLDSFKGHTSSDSGLATQPAISVDVTITTSSIQSSKLPLGQTAPASSRREPGNKSIFLPNFFTSIRSSNSQEATSIDQQHQLEERPQHKIGSSTSNQSSEIARPHIIVTDVRSISFRDISTVPTLTTFGHRRSKRRNSSLSYSSSPASSSLSSNNRSSSASSTSSPSTSRRKRIKKSSHSTITSQNCTASRDHSGSVSSTSQTSEERPTEFEQKRQHRSSESRLMESSGRIRTISESEVAVADRGQSSHRLLHQRQQRRSRQSSSHQQGQEQDADQGHSSMQDPISNHHPLHIHHHHHHQQHQASSTPQHPLQDTQHCCQEIVQDHKTSSNQHQLHIQLRQEREQHHKRQRSPPAQKTTFDSSISSPSSLPVNNMERLKRARHRSSAVSDESTCINDTANKNMSWQDSIENRDEALPTVSHNHVDNRQTNTSLRTHQQQLTQIHPFDNEPATVDVVGHIPCESSPSSRSMPIIPKVTEQLTQTAPSIHPLDAVESQGDTVLRSQEVTAGTKCTTSVLKSDQKVEPATNMMPAEDSNLGKEETTSRAQTLNRSKVGDAKDTGATPSSRPASAAQPSKPSSVLSQTLNPATIMLPITRDTLRELDMMEIFKNPQLRHDIVFDPHLQFRPNFDGERGHVKRREADRFWREVGVELNNRRAILAARRETTATMLDLAELSPSSPTSRLVQQQAQQMCPLPDAVLLPRLINELREILLSLLPQPPAAAQQDGVPAVNPERALLTSTLDPELLLQELDHGVLDVHALFRFLGDSLKGHCAPMRDALVESMVNIVVDFDEIVRGIRMCFEILEWMKLDIANHQLRTLRPWLLDNSIDFEQKHFSSLLARGGTINRTKEWFKRSWIKWDSVKRSVIGQSPNDGEQSGSEGKSLSSTLSSFNANRRSSIIRADIGENILDGVVNEGLLEMVMKPHSSVDSMPETFELDHYRMLSFHNDFQDLTILCTLLILFRQLAQNCWTQQDLVEIKKVVWLLLTDENANFGANTNPGPGATAAAAAGGSDKTGSAAQSHIGSSSGMKDIVVQIEFAARKVRERSKNTASASRRPSIALETPLPLSAQRVSHTPAEALGTNADSKEADASSIAASLSPLTTPSSTSSAPANGLSNSDTNLLTAWLDNALCKTSTLYMLIQKRLLIHFRRWLYVHSCSSMLVLSASCASLASAMSMSSASSNAGRAKATDDDDDDDKISSTSAVVNDGDSKKDQCLENSNENGDGTGNTDSSKPTNGISQGGQASGNGAVSAAAKSAPAPGVAPKLSPEEATKAAVEALAAKLSFNAAEMEAHGLTGLEDEMGALLEKIRAVSEFNKKVYGSWYRDMVKQGRAENWLEKSTSE